MFYLDGSILSHVKDCSQPRYESFRVVPDNQEKNWNVGIRISNAPTPCPLGFPNNHRRDHKVVKSSSIVAGTLLKTFQIVNTHHPGELFEREHPVRVPICSLDDFLEDARWHVVLQLLVVLVQQLEDLVERYLPIVVVVVLEAMNTRQKPQVHETD